MSAGPFFLALAAAMLHALWNSAVKVSADRLIAVSLMTAGAAVVAIPLAIVVGLPPREAWPFLAVSPFVHSAYVVCLAMAYERADLAIAYPIARGVAPMLVTMGGVAFLGDDVTTLGFIGVACVAVALGSMVFSRHAPDGIWWAVLTGLFISTYSLLDAAGVRANDAGMSYAAWQFILHIAYSTVALFALRSRAQIAEAWSANRLQMVAGGAASIIAYLMVLYAAQRAPAGLISGIRETSVIFGVLIAAVVLKERVTRRQILAVTIAALGAVLIGLS